MRAVCVLQYSIRNPRRAVRGVRIGREFGVIAGGGRGQRSDKAERERRRTDTKAAFQSLTSSEKLGGFA